MSKKRHELAKAIARDLFTHYGRNPVVVERIALMKKQDDGTEKSHGGLCLESAVTRIERQLECVKCPLSED